MTRDPLPAHSIAEAKLYLLAHACPSCAHGPVRSELNEQRVESDNRSELVLAACCDACGHRFDTEFTLPLTRPEVSTQVINPGDEPSHILDLYQWMMLSHMLMESARREPNKVRMRQLKIEAGLCLDEALKFYADTSNDLPPAEAFFTEKTLADCRQHPDRFSRDRLRFMRLKLPTALHP